MHISLAYIALQLVFGYFVIGVQTSLISYPFTCLQFIYWFSLIISTSLYFSLSISDPGYINEQDEILQVKNQNPTGQIITVRKDQVQFNDVYQNDGTGQNLQTSETKIPSNFSTQQSAIRSSNSIGTILPSTTKRSQQKQIIPTYLNIEKRYCRHCHIDQPYRCKHCYECQRCVSTYDHHCPWISNCIGQRNRGLFYVFTAFQTFQVAINIFITLQNIPSNLVTCSILISFQLLLIVLTTILFGFHSFLMLIGSTTWQYLKWNNINYLQGFKKPFGPFYEGICKNIYVFWKLTFSNRNKSYQWKINSNNKAQVKT